ncbi:hypothetical protein BSK56_21080 [Paenibacillus borealis]|uniref:Uncharacterized protein n=1 Tax=Paenibacillus borealis TaxID=160799 RepID=A0ABX3H5Z6_PAEBO|nr:hypothetical protein BSK56_21080 [Paenibacillus borealis]
MDSYWEQEYGFIEELQNYLYEWVSQIDIDVERKTELIKSDRDDLYLTFNYTYMALAASTSGIYNCIRSYLATLVSYNIQHLCDPLLILQSDH